VIILDENIPDSQRRLLQSWHIHVRQIGHEVAHKGIKDEGIILLLHKFHKATFFTRDFDFYNQNLYHPNYCLVCLAVGQYEAASFIRRFLHYPKFNTQRNRMGTVSRVSHMGIRLWRLHTEIEEELKWSDEI